MRMKRNRKKRDRKLDAAILSDIVARIVKVAKPQTIILFGSAARGQMGPNSDVDLLVVKSGRFHRRRLAQQIYMRMEGAGEAVDIIVVTPEDVQLRHELLDGMFNNEANANLVVEWIWR